MLSGKGTGTLNLNELNILPARKEKIPEHENTRSGGNEEKTEIDNKEPGWVPPRKELVDVGIQWTNLTNPVWFRHILSTFQ